jgi:hypothetical protein
VFQGNVSECTVCREAVRWAHVATSAEAIARVLGGRALGRSSRGPPAGQLLLPFG